MGEHGEPQSCGNKMRLISLTKISVLSPRPRIKCPKCHDVTGWDAPWRVRQVATPGGPNGSLPKLQKILQKWWLCYIISYHIKLFSITGLAWFSWVRLCASPIIGWNMFVAGDEDAARSLHRQLSAGRWIYAGSQVPSSEDSLKYPHQKDYPHDPRIIRIHFKMSYYDIYPMILRKCPQPHHPLCSKGSCGGHTLVTHSAQWRMWDGCWGRWQVCMQECMLGMCIQQCGCVRVCPDRMDDSHRSYLMSLIVQILFAVSESRNFATLCNQGTGKGWEDWHEQASHCQQK